MSKRLTRILFAASCGALLGAALPNEACADVHDYVRWKPNGQLDYRLLLRRYMPVSSFRYGRHYYGYPYSACGGLRLPWYYYVAPGYYVDPHYYGWGCGYYGAGPLLHAY